MFDYQVVEDANILAGILDDPNSRASALGSRDDGTASIASGGKTVAL